MILGGCLKGDKSTNREAKYLKNFTKLVKSPKNGKML
jgi:hypothetical protein